MIKKIIACSDIHIKDLRGIEEKKESLQNFIEQCKSIVEEYGKEQVRIIVAGDIFDNKISITNESILAVNWFFKELDNICKSYIIAGNHDFLMNNMDRKDSISTIFEIGSFNNVIYLDKELGYKSGCIVDDNITFALWSSFDNFKTPNIKEQQVLTPDNKVVGIIHGDINGSTTATNVVMNKGLDPNIFEDCEFVIAGHIHKHQEIRENGVRIVYCSSITQKDFGETVTCHGYVLWSYDEEEDEWDYKLHDVDNCGRAYYKFQVNSIDDIEKDNEYLINY